MGLLRLVPALFLTAGLLVPGPAAHADPAPHLPRLVDVRAVHRAGVDRVMFQFDKGIPARVDARYVARLLGDGSGLPIRVAGRAVLQVGFHFTRTDSTSTAPRRRAFALPNAMTVVRSGLFEGVTSYGVGLARRTSFEVIRQPARNRVVLAVRAGFRTAEHKVWFLDRDRFVDNQQPFFVARSRPVAASTPASGVMDRIFAGPTERERRQGLRLIRSGARDYDDLGITGGIARVRLRGGCSSGGSTVTIAGSIQPSLRQFDSVDWVKVLDPRGSTADPSGPGDSIPDCLNP